MPTQAQIEANRRNAQLSTGPTTPEGKARSAQNALKHGIRAQAIVSSQIQLLGEDPQGFADFLQSLVEELQPVGALEEMCVETIAVCQWRLRRLVQAELGYISIRQHDIDARYDNPAGHARRAMPEFDILDQLSRYEAHLERQLNRALTQLDKLQTTRHLKQNHTASSLEAATQANALRALILRELQGRHDSRQASPSPARPSSQPSHKTASETTNKSPNEPNPANGGSTAPAKPPNEAKP